VAIMLYLAGHLIVHVFQHLHGGAA
jgi:hypothetical protein